ncbi:cyclopropane-fatty-acyl-phospholipid synthase [Colletotrichum orchidophilum]|uniref:sphingolipid C(9)-methyltransferase n=1 Tax=Colletotrichum orchidophilum TaxID=1209926 RepID=A0A1G4AZN4_9PEZI|nr:cyclopropane-fatty-acyl-phospholipid synthase [Colletotrichum orchidophilum]OHE94604.1 cyclopropane-fatty-acyl-phospholipid synthase [Colletotrichum orchidophilum]
MPELFSSLALGYALVLPFLYLSFSTGGGVVMDFILSSFIAVPVAAGFWLVTSAISPRINETVLLPGLPIEAYLTFKHSVKVKYRNRRKIPMATLCQMYIDGDVEMMGDTLDVLEMRHDWASFRLTFHLIYYFLFHLIPKIVMDFYSHDDDEIHPALEKLDLGLMGCFLGPRMMYTSGIVRNIYEDKSLEGLEDNKLRVICEKIRLNRQDSILSIGYGWEALADYIHGIFPYIPFTGFTHTGEYHNIPAIKGGYKKIVCMHLALHKGPGNFMALHVGPGEYAGFFRLLHGLLDDDGVLFLEVAGARKSWQYEDLIWRLLTAKYVCPDAVPYASLGSLTDQLENAGFQVKSVENISAHHSATVRKWYNNFVCNRKALEATYGSKIFRTFEFFLAYMTIIFRQGSANSYQIVVTKNPNSVNRAKNCLKTSGGAFTRTIYADRERLASYPKEEFDTTYDPAAATRANSEAGGEGSSWDHYE